jgi:Domain of unknown function (DUF6285)
VAQDSPTADELLEAVAEVVGRTRRGERPSSLELRIAERVCLMVAREWRAGEDAWRDEAARLAELLGIGPGAGDPRRVVRERQAQLARRIRDGAYDDRLADLAPVLRAGLRARLAVANPRWLEPS